MSTPKFYSYPGIGEWALTNRGYSQAVRIQDRIECSGQGGWTAGPNGITFPPSLTDEIAQAFINVDTNLRHAGGKGWSQVYRLYSFHTEINAEVSGIMKAEFEKWGIEGGFIWTQIGVAGLGAEGMRVELEVVAWDPEGDDAEVKGEKEAVGK